MCSIPIARAPRMKASDLVIRGGDAILPELGQTACDIAIREGKIAAILAPGEASRRQMSCRHAA